MIYMRILVVVVLLICSNIVRAQEKYEKEVRVKAAEVPPKATALIKGLNLDVKEKWYKEYNLDNIHYELKFRLRMSLWSVEFDESGNLEDVEILHTFRSLSTEEKRAISAFLDQRFSKWKIDRIQKQYKISASSLQQLVDEPGDDYNFEFEVTVREAGEWKRYEFLSDTSMRLMSKRIIRPVSDLNLEF